MERKAEISNFDQEEFESLSDAWEGFKLLLHKCENHNMSVMEQMTHFICGLKTQTRMLLDATIGILREKTDEELNTLIENMG